MGAISLLQTTPDSAEAGFLAQLAIYAFAIIPTFELRRKRLDRWLSGQDISILCLSQSREDFFNDKIWLQDLFLYNHFVLPRANVAA